jgi:polysaccharide biosynthesis protein PslJ
MPFQRGRRLPTPLPGTVRSQVTQSVVPPLARKQFVPGPPIPSSPDAVTMISVFMLLLYAIPSDRSINALGSAGSVATLWALGCGLWWLWHGVQHGFSRRKPHSSRIRSVALLFLAAGIISYIVAQLRALPEQEVSTADTGLIRLCAWVGILLLAHDGVTDGDRFLVLLRRLVAAGGALALLGLIQFFTKRSWIDAISIPGLTQGQGFSNVQARDGFARAAATAQHPLEYAMVLVMVLPIALTLAMQETTRSRLQRWVPVGAIVIALTLSVSRSAIIGLVAGMVVLAPSWSSPVKRITAVVVAAGAGLLYFLVPGMTGTIVGLFTSMFSDASSNSRTGSYDVALAVFDRSPLLGRGFGTFQPEYRILDNQYLQLLIEMGLLGLTLLFVLIAAAAITSAATEKHVGANALRQQLGRALLASITSGAVLLAFFDAFSFPMAVDTFFLILGLCGACRMMSAPGESL